VVTEAPEPCHIGLATLGLWHHNSLCGPSLGGLREAAIVKINTVNEKTDLISLR
jgi:hypothetical protein